MTVLLGSALRLINTTKFGRQVVADVARIAGGYVVVWQDDPPPAWPGTIRILAQLFNLDGTHRGTEMVSKRPSVSLPSPSLIRTKPRKVACTALGNNLTRTRKAQQKAHPKLTLTGMYNVLEKLRPKERFEGKDREIYDQGLIGILRDLHDQIDAAVAEAYGWPADLSDDDILHRLVDLNSTLLPHRPHDRLHHLIQHRRIDRLCHHPDHRLRPRRTHQ